jgi:hypothetical protein
MVGSLGPSFAIFRLHQILLSGQVAGWDDFETCSMHGETRNMVTILVGKS